MYVLSITRNYGDSVRRHFVFLLVLSIGYVVLLWHSLGLPYRYILHEPQVSDKMLCPVQSTKCMSYSNNRKSRKNTLYLCPRFETVVPHLDTDSIVLCHGVKVREKQ